MVFVCGQTCHDNTNLKFNFSGSWAVGYVVPSQMDLLAGNTFTLVTDVACQMLMIKDKQSHSPLFKPSASQHQ